MPRTTPSAAAARPRAVAQARSLAHRMGIPHFTHRPARRVPRRRRGAVHRRLRGGGDAQPVRRLQRPCPARRDARARRPPRLRDAWPPATTRAPPSQTTRAARCCAPPPTPAKDQTYMLAALRPESLARMRFPLGELRKPEVRAIAARRRAAGGRQGRLPGPVLPGRDRAAPGSWSATAASATAPGRDRRPRGAVLGRHDGQHRFTVGQRRGIGVARRRAALRAPQGRRANGRVTVGAARGAAHRPRRASAAARLHRDGAASTASSSATASARSAPASRATRARAATARCRSSSASRSTGRRPASWPA